MTVSSGVDRFVWLLGAPCRLHFYGGRISPGLLDMNVGDCAGLSAQIRPIAHQESSPMTPSSRPRPRSTVPPLSGRYGQVGRVLSRSRISTTISTGSRAWRFFSLMTPCR